MASIRTASESFKDLPADCTVRKDGVSTDTDNSSESRVGGTSIGMPEYDHGEGEDQCYRKHRSITLGSIKEFNFDNTKSEVSDKPTIGSEWWANGKEAGKESKPGNGWTFFPILQPGVS